MASAGDCSDWLENFRQVCQIDAIQFADTWQHYDEDGNGFIDGDEIDSFFNDLLSIGMRGKVEARSLTQADRERLKDEFMNEFDENRDGRIEMHELAKILPHEDNFLTIFRSDNRAISGKHFMQVWRRFAGNRKDYIEAGKLQDFLGALFVATGKGVPPDRLQDYAGSIVRLYDANGDGKLSFKELSRLLPAEENVLLRFKDKMNLTADNFEQLFNHYDEDGNGSIAGEELDVFLKDVARAISNDIADNEDEFDKFKKMMLLSCDESGDGVLQKEEVALWLGVEGVE